MKCPRTKAGSVREPGVHWSGWFSYSDHLCRRGVLQLHQSVIDERLCRYGCGWRYWCIFQAISRSTFGLCRFQGGLSPQRDLCLFQQLPANTYALTLSEASRIYLWFSCLANHTARTASFSLLVVLLFSDFLAADCAKSDHFQSLSGFCSLRSSWESRLA